MHKLCIFISFICCFAFAANDEKLKLLAGSENYTAISRLIRSFDQPDARRLITNDFLVTGPPRNGRGSLVQEITHQVGGTGSSFDFGCDAGNIQAFDSFSDECIQAAQRNAHIAVLTRVVSIARYMHYIEPALKRLRSTKNVCVFAIGPEGCEYSPLRDYFSKHIALDRPNESQRKDILNFYLSQAWVTDEIINQIARGSDGICSGKLKQLADELNVLHEEYNGVNNEAFLELLHRFVPQRKSNTNYFFWVNCASSSLPLALLTAEVVVQITYGDTEQARCILHWLATAREGVGLSCGVLRSLLSLQH